jgi:hypothetical protein
MAGGAPLKSGFFRVYFPKFPDPYCADPYCAYCYCGDYVAYQFVRAYRLYPSGTVWLNSLIHPVEWLLFSDCHGMGITLMLPDPT